MKFVDSSELKSIIIVATGWILIYNSVTTLIGDYFTTFPLLLLPLSVVLFLTTRWFINKVPFLENSELGNLIMVLAGMFAYAMFMKSIYFYVITPYMSQYLYWFMFAGFALIIYATLKLKAIKI